jgi:hypothetical protein|uniref:Uncharacterized protein n=1 Tax=viral metagenome TaxID=1070528 RepID=A0A6C0DQI2_9ZZZZ
MSSSGLLTAITRASLEGFVNPGNSHQAKESYIELVAAILSFMIALIILSLIGKLLWNGVIVELFSFAKPMKSFWQVLGLFLFVSVFLK